MYRALIKLVLIHCEVTNFLLLADLPVMTDDQLVDLLVYRVHEAGGEEVVSWLLITPTMIEYRSR